MILTAEIIAQKLTPDVMLGVYRVEDREFISSKVTYPNGDTVTAYVDRDRVGRARFSDHGTTLERLRAAKIDMTDRREEVVRYVLNRHGMSIEEGAIVSAVVGEPQAAVSAFHRFCRCASLISMFEYDLFPRLKSTYIPKVDHVLRLLAPPKTTVERRFYYDDIDHDRVYPVDWAVLGRGENRHIFAITNRESALMMPSTVYYLRNNGVKAPTIAVFSPGFRPSKKYVRRVQNVAEDVFFNDIAAPATEDYLRKWMERSAA